MGRRKGKVRERACVWPKVTILLLKSFFNVRMGLTLGVLVYYDIESDIFLKGLPCRR